MKKMVEKKINELKTWISHLIILTEKVEIRTNAQFWASYIKNSSN